VHIRAAHTVRTRLARRASDHLPLVVDFEIVPDANGATETA
jgi:endonuclease/exonuclease/phosphatase family metal-dependent hydrolase